MPVSLISARTLSILLTLMLFAFASRLTGADITPFVGSYEGSAEVQQADGSSIPRDMSVEIAKVSGGFTVEWSSTTYRQDGRTKQKTYRIGFQPSERVGVFAAAMRRDVFGHAVPLDPMRGDPYVWARISGDTLTVYSLYVGDDGGYEMQQYDRTLAEGGLELNFERLNNGEPQRTVTTHLKRLD